MEEITNSCLICGLDELDGDFKPLFLNSTGALSKSGQLYEDFLGLKIDKKQKNFYPKFLCGVCDLQMKLFENIKTKAWNRMEYLQSSLEKRKLQQKAMAQVKDYVNEVESEAFGEIEYLEDYLENDTDKMETLISAVTEPMGMNAVTETPILNSNPPTNNEITHQSIIPMNSNNSLHHGRDDSLELEYLDESILVDF